MSELFPIIFSIIFMALVSLISALFLRKLLPAWWKLRWVRLGSYLITIFGALCILLWGIGSQTNWSVMMGVGASGAALAVVIQIAMMLSLPLSWLWNLILRVIGRKHGWTEPDKSRRRFLKTSAVIFPAAAITSGAVGVARSFGDVSIPYKHFKFSNLPDALNGLKILQISDLHLGYYVILSDAEKALAALKEHEPDIILLTGDIADDLTALPYILRMIAGLKPRLGVYSCIGNHEYYRGISEVIQAYNNSPIPLLIGSGLTVDVDETAKLYIGGCDDPRRLSMLSQDFYENAAAKCLKEAPADAFRILMSHRPQGFDAAVKLGVPLTLSGHTHGGQIGFDKRSIFEGFMPDKYLWGSYSKSDECHLYTTSGMGHWFPFRLGCPQEAPIIVLEKA